MSVSEFPGAKRGRNPWIVLDGAREADLKGVVEIGWERQPDGSEAPWYSSSIADAADVCFLLRHFDLRLNLALMGIRDE